MNTDLWRRNANRFFFFFLLAALTVMTQAQEMARLSGTVKDPAGEAVGAATVELINLASNAIRVARVNAAGRYEFESLPPGQYRLVARARLQRRWQNADS
jgi:hypothetical protein